MAAVRLWLTNFTFKAGDSQVREGIRAQRPDSSCRCRHWGAALRVQVPNIVFESGPTTSIDFLNWAS
jgi:hypothetical protein